MLDTLSVDPLQRFGIKEGDVPLYMSPNTNTYINDTNKVIKDDIYSWLDGI